jgi:hypothetical protein
MQAPREFRHDAGKLPKKILSVVVIAKDFASLVTAARNVPDCSGMLQSQQSRHSELDCLDERLPRAA